MKWNKEEETQLHKLFGTVTLIDVGADFVAYSDTEEIALKVYDKDIVYRDLNVKSIEDFMAMLEDDTQFTDSEIENALNYASGYASTYLKGLSIEEQIDFTLEHSGLDEMDIVHSFLEYMVATQKYQLTLGLLQLKDYIDVDYANYLFDVTHTQNFNLEQLRNL